MGNIWEWTASLSDYPDNPHPTVAPEFPDTVITRGGSWFSDSESLGCGVREWSDPETRFNDLGFRIVWVTGART